MRVVLGIYCLLLALYLSPLEQVSGQADKGVKPQSETPAEDPKSRRDSSHRGTKSGPGSNGIIVDLKSALGRELVERLRKRGVTDIPKVLTVVVGEAQRPCSISLDRLPPRTENTERSVHPPEKNPRIDTLPMIAPPCDE